MTDNKYTEQKVETTQFYYLLLFSYMGLVASFQTDFCSMWLNTTFIKHGFPEQKKFGDKFET